MIDSQKSKIKEIAMQAGLVTLEKPLRIHEKTARLFIGIPKENSFQEQRVALTPDSVGILVNRGHRIVIESNAGRGAKFSDTEYSEAGAEIADDLTYVYKADIIIKIAPPSENELKLLTPDQVLMSPIHLPTLEEGYIRSLMEHRITALAFEYIKDDSGTYPYVRSMSEIAGSTVILLAGEFLSNINNGKGVLLGGVSGVPPTSVAILGAGVVGEFAARTALGLGANVKVFDNNVYKLMRLQNNIGHRLYTSTLHAEELTRALAEADVAVGAIHSEAGRTSIIVTEEMVSRMKPGSVVLDVSIDQGGCFETSMVTTHENPTFTEHDIIHYCVPNIPSRVARTASISISNIMTSNLIKASQLGGFENLLYTHEGFRHGVYIYKGRLTNEHLGERFGVK